MKVVLQINTWHISIRSSTLSKSFHQSSHSSIRVSSLFHTKYFPASTSAGAFHYIHTYTAHTVRAHTQTLKCSASSDPNHRKGDGGSEISEQRGAVHVHLCVCVLQWETPGESVLPFTSRLVALMLWLQRLRIVGVKKKVLVRLISLEISRSIISSRNWNHV